MSIKNLVEMIKRNGLLASMPQLEELYQVAIENELKLADSQREFRAADASIENMQMQVEKLTAENAYLLPKAASELSNAWVLHKYLIGIQAAIMYLDNGNKKAAQEWLYGTIAGPGFEFPDEVKNIDEWATHQMRGSVSHQQALEIIKAETPATDDFLAEVRASTSDEICLKIRNAITNCYQDEQVGLDAAATICGEFAAQLRQGGAA